MVDESNGELVVIDFDIGKIEFRLTTVDQAKRDLQIIRARRQEFVLRRRELDNELAEMRAEYQNLLGQLGKTYLRTIPPDQRPKGRFLFWKYDQKKQYTKEDERRMHAERVAPLESEKALIKDAILAIDQAIARLQRFIAEAPPPEKPRRVSAGRSGGKKFCTICGAARSPGEQFCAECGSKFDA